MLGWSQRFVFACLWSLAFAPVGLCQTTVINGNLISHRSSGSGTSSWTLSENGYVGTYFSLASPGSVTLSVNASGSTDDTVLPRLGLVVADTNIGFDAAAESTNYQHTFDLPAGTYFVRTEFNNDVPTANRQLTVNNLTVSGANVSNTTTTAINNASALAAADTYIANFRQGPANVSLLGAAPGTPVEVRMVRNAFNFGTMVQGFDANTFLGPVTPGDTTSTRAQYQNFINEHFNILVPSNMGKWQPNENSQNMPTLGHVDTILNYAQSHNMNVRMHNLIWGGQQPTWVNTLIANAEDPNPAISEPAKASLMTAIANRISYYVGDGDANTNDGDRSRKYVEIDVLNEALREGTYWNIFGAEGIAQIYSMVQDAVEAAGANTRLYTNEYNIFQFSNPPGGGSDPYANWYRRNVEEINNAGYGQVVTGIGIQAISPPSAHSPAKINQVLHNMAVTGLPVTVTEFSVPSDVGATEAQAAQLYNENLRLMFGHHNGVSFLIWEPWPPATTDPTTIMDANWNLRLAGQELVNLLDSWTTPTQNLTVDPNGRIDFAGFYGEYEITVGGDVFDLSLTKGTESYSLVVAVPGDFDDDLDVDDTDLVIWEAGYGLNATGDANGDGDTDGRDFLIWQRNYGLDYSVVAAVAVPEPGACFLFLVGCFALWRRGSRPKSLTGLARICL